MTNEETISKLTGMRLTAMANAFREQSKNPAAASLSFDERLGLLVDIEWTSRKNNRLKKLIQDAKFDQPQAHIADINYTAHRKLDAGLIAKLAECAYIEEKHNVIIMGATGSGKSYLSCAFGIEACKHFHSVRYIRLRESEARDLLEIIHSRHKRASTIFCSQFAPAGWHAKIGEATLADAILDRIVYDSYTIEIHGDKDEPSMREIYGLKA
jgi:DNA replication protein DnaC